MGKREGLGMRFYATAPCTKVPYAALRRAEQAG